MKNQPRCSTMLEMSKEELFALNRSDLCRLLEEVTGVEPTANMKENLPFVDLVFLAWLSLETPLAIDGVSDVMGSY